jgi:hypothetical protein
MKITYLLLVVICLIVSLPEGKSQEAVQSRNSVFMEALGNGGLFSINYERGFASSVYGRLGFGSWTSQFMGSDTKMTTFPVMVSYFTGHGKSHAELGGGILLGSAKDDIGSNSILDLTSFIGYRYQSPGRGILFRVGLTPFLSLDNEANYPDKGFFLSGGVSIGYHF